MTHQLTVALAQMNSTGNKSENMGIACELIKEAASKQVDLVAFPEVFNIRCDRISPTDRWEHILGPSIEAISLAAKSHQIWVLVGSMYEASQDLDKGYNTSVLINHLGEVCAVYRKIHLFDVVMSNHAILESSTCFAGNSPTIATIKDIQMGMSICYDLRFPELYRFYSKNGAEMISVPSSFLRSTGQYHWEVLLRARAIENQCFVIAPNQVGIGTGGQPTFGNSMIIDYNGVILSKGSEDAVELVIATLDFQRLRDWRMQFPSLTHRRL